MNKRIIEELTEAGYTVAEVEGAVTVSRAGFTVTVGGDRPQLKQMLYLPAAPTTTVVEERFTLLFAAREVFAPAVTPGRRESLESEALLKVAGGVFQHTEGHWTWDRGTRPYLVAFGRVEDLPSLSDESNTSWRLSIDVDQLEADLGAYVLRHLGSDARTLNKERVRFLEASPSAAPILPSYQ